MLTSSIKSLVEGIGRLRSKWTPSSSIWKRKACLPGPQEACQAACERGPNPGKNRPRRPLNVGPDFMGIALARIGTCERCQAGCNALPCMSQRCQQEDQCRYSAQRAAHGVQVTPMLDEPASLHRDATRVHRHELVVRRHDRENREGPVGDEHKGAG